MFSKLFLASVATISLLLAGPQKASAQVVYACVSSIGNIAIVASASASCPPSAGGPTWTKVTLGAGALGASQFNCAAAGNSVANGDPLSGIAGYLVAESFGSGIAYTPRGFVFVLQPGFYLIQLSVPDVFMSVAAIGQAILSVHVLVNGTLVDAGIFGGSLINPNNQASFSVNGELLLQITAANTVIGFNVAVNTPPTPTIALNGCRVTFTRMQ